VPNRVFEVHKNKKQPRAFRMEAAIEAFVETYSSKKDFLNSAGFRGAIFIVVSLVMLLNREIVMQFFGVYFPYLLAIVGSLLVLWAFYNWMFN